MKILKLLTQLKLNIKYAVMSKRTLVLMTNRSDFSNVENNIVGYWLNKRFKQDEELEEMCKRLLGV